MELRTIIYDKLHKDCKRIREKVFMNEQGFKFEFDAKDDDATHIVIYDGDLPVATGRLITDDGAVFVIGKVAVLKEYRHRMVGSILVRELEKEALRNYGSKILIFAQKRAAEFYKSLGYCETTEKGENEGVALVTMIKMLSCAPFETVGVIA